MYPEEKKRVKWTCWDWNRSLREGRSGVTESHNSSEAEVLDELLNSTICLSRGIYYLSEIEDKS